MRQLLFIGLLCAVTVACSKGDQARIPAQLWNDIILK